MQQNQARGCLPWSCFDNIDTTRRRVHGLLAEAASSSESLEVGLQQVGGQRSSTSAAGTLDIEAEGGDFVRHGHGSLLV